MYLETTKKTSSSVSKRVKQEPEDRSSKTSPDANECATIRRERRLQVLLSHTGLHSRSSTLCIQARPRDPRRAEQGRAKPEVRRTLFKRRIGSTRCIPIAMDCYEHREKGRGRLVKEADGADAPCYCSHNGWANRRTRSKPWQVKPCPGEGTWTVPA